MFDPDLTYVNYERERSLFPWESEGEREEKVELERFNFIQFMLNAKTKKFNYVKLEEGSSLILQLSDTAGVVIDC